MKRIRIRITVLCFIMLGLFAVLTACAQKEKPKDEQNSEIANLIGDWSGESICVNKEKFPACNDEVVVYHIKEVAGKADTVNLSADKIVNGKPEFMGAFDFIYDSKKHTLTSDVKNERVHFLIEFVVKDDVLEGGITSLPDKTQVRQIKVKKDK
jgi:hypothetical protein